MTAPFPDELRDRKVAYGRTCPICLRPVDHGGHTKIGGGGGANYIEEQWRCEYATGKLTDLTDSAAAHELRPDGETRVPVR